MTSVSFADAGSPSEAFEKNTPRFSAEGYFSQIAPSGFEPETTDPESVVLPTTPRGKFLTILLFPRTSDKDNFHAKTSYWQALRYYILYIIDTYERNPSKKSQSQPGCRRF